MSTIQTYVRWLSDKGYLTHLTAVDVPLGQSVRPYPKFLMKEELAQIMQYLENNLVETVKSKDKELIYAAYMWRALVWFLYTTGLRNAEIRAIKFENINLPF